MVEGTGRLAGRVATITGGSTGIGRGIAELFLREGASVGLLARDADRLAATVRALDDDDHVIGITGDVADTADVERFVDATIDRFGRLDIHVSNAGIHRVVPFLETSDATWDEVFRTNVRGAFLGCRAAAHAMAASGGGAIVVIGSTNSFVAEPHMAAYNASKAALVLLVRSMAVDLAAERIRVNLVAPGTIVSEITKPMLAAGFGFVLWLASDEAAYITGATIVVDGGQLALNGDIPMAPSDLGADP